MVPFFRALARPHGRSTTQVNIARTGPSGPIEGVERHTGGSGVQPTPHLSQDVYKHGLRIRSDLQGKAGGEEDEDGRSIRGRVNPVRLPGVDHRASTTATMPQGRGTEAPTGHGEEQRKVELKKFSLRP